MRNIMEIVRLVKVLEDERIDRDEKIEEIKMVRDNGDITSDEAVELAVEYC